MSNSKRNFYEILNAAPSATLDELKTNYKQLILQCHPDKLQQQFKSNTNCLKIDYDDLHDCEFVLITEAWNCLKDPVKRKKYDAELLLNKFHTHNNIYAHIKLSEMKKQPNTNGDNYGHQEDKQKVVDTKLKESEENETKYLYTYDCRCGGQYIVDESAEQYCGSTGNNQTDTQIKKSDNDDDNDNNSVDDADGKQYNNNRSNNVENNGGDGAGSAACAAGSEGVAFVQHNQGDDDDDEDYEEDEGGELIVECSECSLVIILNG